MYNSTVHNSTVYITDPDDSPERQYEVGLNFLSAGLPDMARQRIDEARSRGLDGPEIRFQLLLAILSKKSYRDVDAARRVQLDELRAHVESQGSQSDIRPDAGAWRRALGVAFAFLACVDGTGGDSGSAEAQLQRLPEKQRGLILRHLSLVFTGAMKVRLWGEIRDRAMADQTCDNRTDRVWSYFEPKPANPRAFTPAPESVDDWALTRALLLAGLVAAATAALGAAALGGSGAVGAFACLAAVGLCTAAARDIAFWHHRLRRREAMEQRFGYRHTSRAAPTGGFADRVDRAFDHYFGKYAPAPEDRDRWREQTEGVRRGLREEIVTVYRDSEVQAGEVHWLIRFMVRDVRRRWRAGLPLEPGELFGVPLTQRFRTVTLGALGAAALVTVAVLAFAERPLFAAAAAVVAVAAARFAVPLGLHLHSERRRIREEEAERAENLTARAAEHRRWSEKLAALRPTEEEMERWLAADQLLILDEALRYYRLGWHDVIAHAFLSTPAKGNRSAHAAGGPMRYSRYQVRVFLVTDEGVREATAVLDFERARWRGTARNHYRFDAISSVQVEIAGESRYTLKVTLTNGPTTSIVVSESTARHLPADYGADGTAATAPLATTPGSEDDGDPPDSDNADEPARLSLEVAGFLHTLRILEGIAAEGKTWFDRSIDSAPPGSSAPPSAA